MYKFVLIIGLIFVAGKAHAQNGVAGTVPGANGGPSTTATWNSNGGMFSSTPAEGYLRGIGSLWSGLGNYLESMGVYENLHEVARQKYLVNEYNRVQGRWSLQDQAVERRKANHKNYIDREHARLDKLEEMANLAIRKENVQKRLNLPPRTESKFVWRGHEFKNYAEFRKSPQWLEMQTEWVVRNIHQNIREEKLRQSQQDSLEIIRKFRKMSPVDHARYESLKRAEAVLSR